MLAGCWRDACEGGSCRRICYVCTGFMAFGGRIRTGPYLPPAHCLPFERWVTSVWPKSAAGLAAAAGAGGSAVHRRTGRRRPATSRRTPPSPTPSSSTLAPATWQRWRLVCGRSWWRRSSVSSSCVVGVVVDAVCSAFHKLWPTTYWRNST